MKKGVVYTCLFGQKEELIFRRTPGSKLDHIIFTDQALDAPEECQVIIIHDSEIGPERLSRKPKLLPHRYLRGYDWSLYVDNRARLKVVPEKVFDRYLSDSCVPFFSFRHPWWNSVYTEAEKLIELCYDEERVIRAQIDLYKSKGFPESEDMIAGTVLLRMHDDANLIAMQEDWFEHVNRYSKRDQLSFNYLRWRHGLNTGYFDGSLVDNEIMEWLAIPRIDPSFDFAAYAWLARSRKKIENDIRLEYRENSSPEAVPKRHYWELERLFNKYKSDKGSIYYNAHGYCFVYEQVLRHLKSERLKLLEVGLLRHDVQQASNEQAFSQVPSLSAWEEYFPNARIVGFDIADFSNAHVSERTQIVSGDSSSPSDIHQLIQQVGTGFDIVIEDASHASHHQQVFIGEIIEHLNPGGHLFIEDLHYQPPGLERSDAPKTIDVLKGVQRGDFLNSPYIPVEKQRRLAERAESITFWDSRETFFGSVPKDALCHIKIRINDTRRVTNTSSRKRGKKWFYF